MSIKEYEKTHSTHIDIPENGDIWVICSPNELALKKKMESVGTPLKDWNVSINYGIKTGCSDVFIIDNETKETLSKEDPKSAEILKPILRGKNIKRYQAKWAGLWLIDTHNGYGNIPPIDVEHYPVVKKYLDRFYSQLEKRQDKGITPYNLRHCAYHAEFMRDKIVYPNMTKFLPFTLDSTGKFTNEKCFIITGHNLKFLVGILNSKIGAKWLRENCPKLAKEGRELSKIFFENIPIPTVVSENKKITCEVESIVDNILLNKNRNIDTSKLEAQIDRLVYQLYGLTNEEINLVESTNI